MKNVDKLLVMLDFLREEEISTKNMKASYDDERDILTLENNYTLGDSNVLESVTVRLNEEKNSVVIKKDTRVEHDFHTIGNDHMTNYEIYKVDSVQHLIEYNAIDDRIYVSRASVSQSMKEDTLGGGAGLIVDVNSISDLTNEDKSGWFQGRYKVEEESYSIPAGYKITDGVPSVKKEQLQKVKK